MSYLKGKFVNTYRKEGSDGVMRRSFVYSVHGTEDELQKFIEVQNKNLSSGCVFDDDKNPLFWSQRALPQVIDLVITPNGRVVVENDPIGDIQTTLESLSGIDSPELKANVAALFAEKIVNKKGEFRNLATSTKRNVETEMIPNRQSDPLADDNTGDSMENVLGTAETTGDNTDDKPTRGRRTTK